MHVAGAADPSMLGDRGWGRSRTYPARSPSPEPRSSSALALAALSAALLLAAAPPAGIPLLAFVALMPLLVVVRRTRSGVAAAALGWLTGALFYAGLLPWLVPTLMRMQDIGATAAAALFGLFVAYHAGQFALAALAMSAVGSRPGAVRAALTVAAAWVVVEWAYPQVLPWSLGALLGPQRTLRQAADLAGVHGLAASIVAVNVLLAFGARRVGVSLIAALLGYGLLRQPSPADGHLRVGVIQAATPALRHDPDAANAVAWRSYAARSAGLARRVDLLLWPEGVLRADLGNGGGYRRDAEQLAAALQRPLLLGALGQGGNGRETNVIYAFAPRLLGRYAKHALVPFGESVPTDWWPLDRWRTTGAFAPAAANGPLRLTGGAVAVAVCFEALRGDDLAAQVAAGAGWLLNPSDDSWFASPRAAAQHLEMTRLRAVETRRWLVRVSHSGASAVIDPGGEIVAALPYGAAGELVARIAPLHQLTPFTRWGDTPLLLASAAVLLGSVGRAGRPFGRPALAVHARSNNSTSASLSACSATALSSLSAAPSPACRT
ncbi:MAG: apolipoprotein N-acyltransferase [Deltaproteobacteria bacterium]|nr:apolipoprotein N-acyltransferase [Deltaproteobacteria bacterium]